MKILMNMIVMIMLSVNAFGAISPAIRVGNILISPSPMKAVENNGEGNATFNLYESNDVDVPASISGDVNTEITVDLNKAILKDNDISNVTGAMAQYFDIMTINGGKTILFEQKDTIPGDSFGEIRILVEVTENAFAPTTNKVGLLVNISATTGSAGDGSASTYTSLPERPVSPLVLEINSTDVNETTPTTVLTNDNTPEIAGVCTAGDTVTVQIDGEDITPTTVCTEDGTFSITPDEAIDDGEHDVTATQTNPNTNLTSEPSPVDKLIVDTTPTAAPTVLITEDTNDDGNITTSDELDGDVDVTITMPAGTEVGDILTITNPDGSTRDVPVTQDMINDGYNISYSAVTDGSPMKVTATITDAVGNISPEGNDEATIVDDIAPSEPTVEIIEDTNNDGDITTSDELDGEVNVMITLPEDAEIGDTLTVTNPDGTTTDVVVTEDMINNGHPVSYPAPQNGEVIEVKAILTDKAGNTSPEGSDSAKIVDDIVPSAPLVLEINSTDVNETTPTTVLTNDNTPEIAGVCTAGDTVTVQIDGEDITPTTVCTEDGTFSITPDEAIDDGEHDVTATQTNPTNNLTSEPSPVDKLIVDTTLPEVAITTVNDANTSTVMTLDTTPEINGTCTGDGTVTVYIDGEMITPTAMCVDGAYSITPDTEIELGDHNVTVTEEDEAGNIATAGPVQLTIKGKPDYTPKIKLVGAVTHGTDVTVPAVLTISELDGGMNGSDVVIRIPKHTYLSFSYDSSMTTLIGKTLNNGDWEIDETRPSEYRFKYVGNGGIFPSNGVSRIGINLTIAPDTANSGEIDFLLDIKPGNGDENQDNDQDASKIGYDN